MEIQFHPHALERLQERGATKDEIKVTIQEGEQFPAKFGRTGFRRNFSFEGERKGRHYATKQIEAYAVKEKDWLVITVIVKYF